MNSLKNVNKPALAVSIAAASVVGYIVYSSYSSTLKTIQTVKESNVSWLGELIENYRSPNALESNKE